MGKKKEDAGPDREYKFTLRIPENLWEMLNLRAEINRRSLNSEILVILERVAFTAEHMSERRIYQYLMKKRPGKYPPEGLPPEETEPLD